MRLIYAGLFSIFCLSTLCAQIEKYFKIPAEKTGGHDIANVDFIYMINLDQRSEKYAMSIEQLAPYGITPYRFSAVNGWELSLEAINDLGVKLQKGMRTGFLATYYPLDKNGQHEHEVLGQFGRNYFCHCMARGSMGCALSHLSILQDAYDSGYETIWVMEDDIQIIRNPHIVSDLIKQLDRLVGKGYWDILYTDRDTKNGEGKYVPCTGFALRPDFYPSNPHMFKVRENVTKDLRRVGARYGTYSMIIRRSGMKKILDFYKKHQIFCPIDMDLCTIPGIFLYTVQEDVVSTFPNAISDNGGANYLTNNP